MRKGVFVLQILMGLWSATGAWYMMGHYAELGSAWALATLPAVFWTGLGIVQIVLAVGLVLSVRRRGRLHQLAAPAAVGLAVISLLGVVLYSAYAGFPGILWAIIPGALFGFIAYKRRF
jgi:predicted cation transporter